MSSLPLNQSQITLSQNMSFIDVFNMVIDGVNQLAVNARDLHQFLKVGKRFTTWIQGRISEYEFSKNLDFISFSQIGEKLKGGRPSTEYHITLDMAKELSMVEKNEQGRKARRYFIQCEKALHKTGSRQREALITACDKLAISNTLRSDVYKMVAEHFGYDKPKDIPDYLLPDAVAFVYELLLSSRAGRSNTVELVEQNTKYLVNHMYHISRWFRQIREPLGMLHPDIPRQIQDHMSSGMFSASILNNALEVGADKTVN